MATGNFDELNVKGGIRMGAGQIQPDFWGGKAKLCLPNGAYLGNQGSYGVTMSWNTYRKSDNTFPVLKPIRERSRRSFITQNWNGIAFGTSDQSEKDSPSVPFRLAIKPDGRVGIGTFSPKAKLDVQGGIGMGAGQIPTDFWGGKAKLSLPGGAFIGNQGDYGVTISWNTYRTSANTYPVLKVIGGGNRRSSITQGTMGITFSTSDQTATVNPNLPIRLAIKPNGRVGIGTNNPKAKLDVQGSISARGNISVTNASGKNTIHLDGNAGNLKLGGGGVKYEFREPGDFEVRGGVDGDIGLWPSSALDTNDWNKASIHLEADGANIKLGGGGRDGDIGLWPASAPDHSDWGKANIHLNGDAGDIILRNADCAEDFDVAAAEVIEPGTVMVIHQEDQLRQSTAAYDKKVAGVVSGAGDYRPGIVLDRKQSQNTRMPVAVMGKVYCKVDARNAPIEVGDLLTTSETPGHAMKAIDPLKGFGAVIGKALRPFKAGEGIIPILVALQ